MQDDQVEATLKDLINESVTKFGHERKTVKHPSNPLLHRYMYIFDEGSKATEEDAETLTLGGSTNLSNRASLGAICTGPSENIEIKYERASDKTMKELLTCAESCKKVLTPQYNVCRDLVAKVQVNEIKEGLQKASGVLDVFIEGVRQYIIANQGFTSFSDDTIAERIAQGNKMKAEGVVHQDVIKIKIKQARACI